MKKKKNNWSKYEIERIQSVYPKFNPLQKSKIKTPCTREASERLRGYKYKNLSNSLRNPNENWFAGLLDESCVYSFGRQKLWGHCIFDFWCAKIGVVIEIDGKNHNAEKDRIRDEINFNRSGIVTLRVRNMNEEDAEIAIQEANSELIWWQRRQFIGLPYESITFGYTDHIR